MGGPHKLIGEALEDAVGLIGRADGFILVGLEGNEVCSLESAGAGGHIGALAFVAISMFLEHMGADGLSGLVADIAKGRGGMIH